MMSLRRSAAACLGLTLLLAPINQPAEAVRSTRVTASDEVARLAAVAELWTTVRYAHPGIPTTTIDWDAALIAALPRIRAASSAAEYADAVAGMLAALKDPATRILDRQSGRSPSPPPPTTEQQPHLYERGQVVVLRMTDYLALADVSRVMGWLPSQLPTLRDATAIVIDLRQRTPGPARYVIENFFGSAAPVLTSRRISPPAVRTVVHSGYAPQMGASSGGYFSALQVSMPAVIQPAANVAAKRVAFIVNQGSAVPAVALALQQNGDGVIVSEGPIDDTAVAPSMAVNMGDGITAVVRTGEVVQGAGGGLQADVTVAAPVAGRIISDAGSGGEATGTADPGMAAALAFVSGGARPSPPAGAPAASSHAPVWQPDAVYAEMPYPPVEYRLLGVYRLWGIVNYFFPYKHLMSRDWDAALAQFIPRAIAAKDALEYGQTIAEMATWLEDSHVGVDSPALRAFYGEAGPPLTLRYVEDQPVVTALLDEPMARAAGVEIGDVVVRIDGQEVAAKAASLQRFLTVSNPWAGRVKLTRYLAAGPDGSDARLALRKRDGGIREVVLPRRTSFATARPVSAAPSYRRIASDIGYVDLTRLEPREVDPMVDDFQETKAIIFDMRGYPRGVFMALGARLNRLGAVYAATFLRPMLSAGSPEIKYTFQQRFAPTTRPVYRGRTIMLIDERAISQSEHTGLFLEQASGVTFIGSPTAGANGDVTRLVLPGRVTVGFTGHDVRHADGRQLQKVGLEPHIQVRPTIAGIRDGKDEVLDRALRFAREGQ